METSEIPFLTANKLELHYWFKDESHTMDAMVQNRCEFELLGIVREVALSLNLQVVIETEPVADGGLRRWFKLLSKSEKKSATVTIAIATTLVSVLLVTPLTVAVTKLTEKVIERIFEDKELTELQKEELRARIVNLNLDSENKRQKLLENNKIAKKRSNFYDTLYKYPKVIKISVTVENENNKPVLKEQFIPKAEFNEFILNTDKLEPEVIEGAVIEIISPVLKKGNYQWKGIYNGEIISFNLKSNEFKTLVQTGKIEFKNGSSIICPLEIERILDNDGGVKITAYNIPRVDEYFLNGNPVETPEGKKHKQKIEAENRQYRLSFDNPEFE